MSAPPIAVLSPPHKPPVPRILVPEMRVVNPRRMIPATRPAAPIVAARGRGWFSESLLEMSNTRPKRHTSDVLASAMFHVVVLTALLVLPLYYTQTLDMTRFTETLLVPPPPPPPAPPPATNLMKARPTPPRSFLTAGKLLAPVAIPAHVAMLKEEPVAPDENLGVPGGVLGGVPGGQMGGVLGGIISQASRTYVPPPPQAMAQTAPILVGGRVKRPRLVSQTPPAYPVLARQTRLQGDVVISAVIDTEGNVVDMQVVSGSPLLIGAALDAVRQWKYEPTYLDEKPVSVRLNVTVTFSLASS